MAEQNKALDFDGLQAKAVHDLRRLQACDDVELAHIEADQVLCNLLSQIGFQKVVAAWSAVGKYYA